MEESTLNPKQELFCQYYSAGMGIEASCKKAGYLGAYTQYYGLKLLRRQDIKDRIAELNSEITVELEINRERVAQNLLAIAEPEAGVVVSTKDKLAANKMMIELYGLAEPEKKDISITGIQFVVKDVEQQALIESLVEETIV
jgi:phage terminase small subunit